MMGRKGPDLQLDAASSPFKVCSTGVLFQDKHSLPVNGG